MPRLIAPAEMAASWRRQFQQMLNMGPDQITSMELFYDASRAMFPLVVERGRYGVGGPADSYTFDLTPPHAENTFGPAAIEELLRRGGSRPVVHNGIRWEVQPLRDYEPRGATRGGTPPVDPPGDLIDLSPETLESLPGDALSLIRGLRRRLRTSERNYTELVPRATRSESGRLAQLREVERLRAELIRERQTTAQLRETLTRTGRELDGLTELKRTALIWRDRGNGAEAQLDAFTNFCEALDSLPAPQEPAPSAAPVFEPLVL